MINISGTCFLLPVKGMGFKKKKSEDWSLFYKNILNVIIISYFFHLTIEYFMNIVLIIVSVIIHSLLFTKFIYFLINRHLAFPFFTCMNTAAVYIFSISHFQCFTFFFYMYSQDWNYWIKDNEHLLFLIRIKNFPKMSLQFTHLPTINVFFHFTFPNIDIFTFLEICSVKSAVCCWCFAFDFTCLSEVLILPILCTLKT